MSAFPTPLGHNRGPLAPNYGAYGVSEPTPEQQVKLAEQAIRLDVEQYGAWPNPAKEPNRLENWRGRMSHRMNAYLKAFDIHNSNWPDILRHIKATMEAEKRFEWSYAKELADKEIGIYQRNKGKTVADDIPGGDMTKKQAPHHSATAEQVAEAKEAFAKALAVPPVSPEVQAKANQLTEALDRILREMKHSDPDHTLRRNVYRRYGGATAEKVVVHPDYVQLKVEEEFTAEITRVRNPIPIISQEEFDADIAAPPPDDKLDDWFPRGNEASKPSDEAPAHWSKDPAKLRKFYGDVKGYCNKYPQFRELHAAKVSEFVHDAIYFDHLEQTPLDPNETLTVVKAYADKKFAQPAIEKVPEKPATENAVQNTPISNQEATTLNETKPTEVIPPENVERPKIAPLLNEGKIHHMEAPVIAYTTIIINDHRVNVTAREGATAEQVHDTVIALIDGLRLIAKDDTITSYAAVVDGRDKVHTMKGNIKVVDAPHIPPAVATVPTPSNGNGSASNGDGGTVACMMIEVATAYNGKTALKFSCDGYENPLQFAKQPGEMVKLLAKIKRPDGGHFTAEDLTLGRKFGGAWKVVWRDGMGKDEKMHRNVIDVLPA